jgi:hypothetical protein
MASITIEYYFPTATPGAPVSTGLIATSAPYTPLSGGGTPFTLPNLNGSPDYSFSPPIPSNLGNNITGWYEFTDTGGNYPISKDGSAPLYWLDNIGEPGSPQSIDAIFASKYNSTPGTYTLKLAPYYETPVAPVICFKEDSEILTYDEAADKESYVKVQDLRKGMLVKTLRSGYVPVKIATTSKVYNSGNGKRSENCLYRCPTSVFPELKEDLIITGHHSILVDNLTEEQVNEIQDTYGRIYITEKKYRLPAFVDERTVPYEEEGTFNIYHFALENSNVKANYGVYANGGLLVESANEWRLREKSGHKIISE